MIDRRDIQTNKHTRRTGILLGLGLLVASSRFGMAQPPASYWGPLPPPADSVTVQPTALPRPAWETVLMVPYRICALPFNLVRYGCKGAIIALDESGTIYQVKRLLGPQQGPFGVTLRGDASTINGYGGGLTATHDDVFSPQNQMKLRWKSTSEGAHKLTVGFTFARWRPARYVLAGGYRMRPNCHFYGIGPTTRKEKQSEYTQETSWVGVSLQRTLTGDLATEAAIIYSGVGAWRAHAEDDPQLDEIFDPVPYGFQRHSEGITLSLALSHDTTVQTGRPLRGGIRRLKASYFEDACGEPVAFWTYRADLQEFFGLGSPRRTLALRAQGTWLDPKRETAIPFQRLMTNDDPDLLRGYRDFRWRDRGLVTFSLEYRWPLWGMRSNQGLNIDGYIFSDGGQVFTEFSEISGDRLVFCLGWGLRIVDRSGFRARFEMGRSKEETTFRLSTDQIYQFAKEGLQHGRDQVALR